METVEWPSLRLFGYHLRDEGVQLSLPTIKKILNRNSLGTAEDRWLRLHEKAVEPGTKLSAQQRAFIKRPNILTINRRIYEASVPESS